MTDHIPSLDHLHAERKRLNSVFWPLVTRRPAAAKPPAQPFATPPKRDVELLTGSPLNARLTFSTFLAGERNQLAFVEAQRCALALQTFYNPLFLYGAPGLGKTHLLQATTHALAVAKRRVIYLTSERFMYGFAAALKDEKAFEFNKRLKAFDTLVIDDIQFLRGKIFGQVLCQIVDVFLNSGRQIVIAADRPPGDLESLEERVRSRLKGGLCVEIGAPDEQLRIKILEARIAAARQAHPAFEVSAEVISYVARLIQTNGRDLLGAVNRLVAHWLLQHPATSAPISMETAELAIRDLVRDPAPKRLKIADIQKLVASHFQVSLNDIMSARRNASVVRARHVAMYLAKLLTPKSLLEISRRFGGRDHTTVLHAVRKITNIIDGRSQPSGCGKCRVNAPDTALAEEIAALREMLLG
jgi:chromosomal replication initiator protein